MKKKTPELLDRIADKVLSYRPAKSKIKPAPKRRKRKGS